MRAVLSSVHDLEGAVVGREEVGYGAFDGLDRSVQFAFAVIEDLLVISGIWS